MPRCRFVRSTEITRTPRVVQCEGIFDVPAASQSELSWDVDLPIEDKNWQIGLIVGPSGSGKSVLLEEMFRKPKMPRWPKTAAVVDGFPESMPVRDITGALSAVGFSSPPSWLRPYNVLSNGERFRADLARLLAESADDDLTVIDEFTSVVDRTVAKVASAAVAKHVRRGTKRLVVASCHYDIVDWLQPDWQYDTGSATFEWRCLQPRPRIELEIYRSTPAAWETFRRHHYLTAELHRGAACFVGLVEGRPAVFTSAIKMPHRNSKNLIRGHRTVCLPDFQGVGIGNAMAETVASCYRARGMRWRATVSSPAMIRYRARSPLWRMDRKPSFVAPQGRSSGLKRIVSSTSRLTATFEYVGPPASAEQATALLG